VHRSPVRLAASPEALLVIDRQRWTTPEAKRCPNARPGLRLRKGSVLLDVRCKRRTCPVCGPKRARETARVLLLDALVDPPTHGITLTTVDPFITAETFRLGVKSSVRRLRRRFGRQVEYYGSVEFTTGKAETSGGYRRIHEHLVTKGLQGSDVLEVESLLRQTWQEVTGAKVVEVAELLTPGGAIGYLAMHHRKPRQAPPKAWRGMVERPSKGYFHRPVAELRAEAKAQLRVEAIAWREGITVELAQLEVAAESGEWELERFEQTAGGLLIPWGNVPVRARDDERQSNGGLAAAGCRAPFTSLRRLPASQKGRELMRKSWVKKERGRERGLGLGGNQAATRWLAENDPEGRRYVVWVNKRSGMAHRKRGCETLLNVPNGALREVTVEDGIPRFRYCSVCSFR